LLGQFSSLAFYAGACAYQGLYGLATSYQLGVIATLDSKGKFIVIMTALQGLGAALGPSIAAALVSDGDYSLINWAAAGALGLSLGIFLVLCARNRGRLQ
jgi:MFS family permease